MRFATLIAAVALAILATLPAPSGRAQSVLSPDFAATEPQLSPSERAGREILDVRHRLQRPFLHLHLSRSASAARSTGTASSAPSIAATSSRPGGRSPIPTAASRAIRTARRASPTETWGFPWCPGDDQLLAFVGREGYRDPACDFEDAPFDTSTAHGAADQRQSTCDLYFGTSTGALGLRKFPNPRFEPAAWEKIGGWEGYAAFLSDDPRTPTAG